MIRQLAHLNFITNDLNRIIDFYVNKPGIACGEYIRGGQFL